MQIAIIGAGNVGRALTTAWRRAGHTVTLGVRAGGDEPARTFATSLGADVATPGDAAANAGTIVPALPWAAAESVVGELGGLAGKTVIDCMNPIARTPQGMGLALGHDTSGGEQVAAWFPDAHVVKTLNQVGAEIMADASGFPAPPAMFMAGDNEPAKARVAVLLADLGFEPLDAGDITKARLLEPYALVWINQAIARGKGRNWALAALERGARS